MLEEGIVGLTVGEIEALGLPRHSASVPCRFRDEAFSIDWRGSDREVAGEKLAEVLQLEASVDWVVRLHPGHDGIELELGPPATSRLASRPLFDPVTATPRRTAARKAEPASRRGGGRATPIRHVRQDRLRLRAREEYDWQGPIGIHRPTRERFAKHIGDRGWDGHDVFGLRLEGELLAAKRALKAAASGGAITVLVSRNATPAFVFAADAGYHVLSVTVDGAAAPLTSPYTFGV